MSTREQDRLQNHDTEASIIEMNRRGDDAFTLAMLRAAMRKKERVKVGIVKDHSALPLSARRFAAEATGSITGSPAAMCVGR